MTCSVPKITSHINGFLLVILQNEVLLHYLGEFSLEKIFNKITLTHCSVSKDSITALSENCSVYA